MIDFQKEYKLLHQAENLLIENKLDEINLIFKEIYGDDTLKLRAHILAESNPEYSLYSKELNDMLYNYYMNILMSKIF